MSAGEPDRGPLRDGQVDKVDHVDGDEWGEWGAADEPADVPHDTHAGEDTDHDEPQALVYATVEEFVTHFLATIGWVDTSSSGATWCPEWWRHTAAVVRLEALHRSFEALREDPGLGISTWLRDHLDRHMPVLTAPDGPFKGCSPNKGHDANRDRTLACAPAPEGLFEPGD